MAPAAASRARMCLRATRVGLLDFRWTAVPAVSWSKIAGRESLDPHSHCEACKIDFTVDFDRYVELTFRPNPAVRRVEVQSYCVGSPQLTPHVVAQQLLPAGDKRVLTLPLEDGRYRLRTLELPGSQDVDVSPEGERSVVVTVSKDGGIMRRCTSLRTSRSHSKNTTDTDQLVMLEDGLDDQANSRRSYRVADVRDCFQRSVASR